MLNLVLLASLTLLLARRHKTAAVPPLVLSEAKSPATPAPAPAPEVVTQPFHWKDLDYSKDYRAFIANLRALGCPEASVADIVRGNVDRAYSWERSQLNLDGSGDGPWSQEQETQLVASLLNGQSMPKNATSARGPGTESPSPLFLQNVDWSAMGFTADQQAEIAQVRQQFQDETANLNPDSTEAASQNPDAASPFKSRRHSATLTPWQRAVQDANDQLRGLLGSQAYGAYELQQYYNWYQPQAVAATANSAP